MGTSPPNLMARPNPRLTHFMRVLNSHRSLSAQHGATRDVIEGNTFSHKYKRRSVADGVSEDDALEKCTICLSVFENDNDCRYIHVGTY